MRKRGSKKRVLVVDDDAEVTHLLKLHLHRARYQVMAAANTAEALQQLQTTPAHAAIVDVRLGTEDGITLMEQLHQIQPNPPVIISTASATSAGAVRAITQGACDYLAKPFNATELLSRVAAAVTVS